MVHTLHVFHLEIDLAADGKVQTYQTSSSHPCLISSSSIFGGNVLVKEMVIFFLLEGRYM